MTVRERCLPCFAPDEIDDLSIRADCSSAENTLFSLSSSTRNLPELAI
jgi:hypothetical protein